MREVKDSIQVKLRDRCRKLKLRDRCGKLDTVSLKLANNAVFLKSCVAKREDGPRHLLHASVFCHEHNEDLIFFIN